MALPRFTKNFRERTREAWTAFARIEGTLRQIMDTDKSHQRSEELIELCSRALEIALSDTAFELGFNGEKYELILSPEGLRSRLFPLVYFQQQAPESVLAHWNIRVGRQPAPGFLLRTGEIEIRVEDVQMWAEKTEDQRVSLGLYCEKLISLLKEDTDKVWWALSMLVDQTVGEISSIAFVAGFDVYAQPKEEPAMCLSQLPELLQGMGLPLWRDGSDYLENSYLTYELEPVEDPEADWRLDVYAGSCRLPVLINDYMAANVEMTVKGMAAAYGVQYRLTRMGEAVTYKGDEEAVEAVKQAARTVEGVDSVVDMNAKVGSEDCTMLIRRVQQHGGKAVFFYYGCNHPGHHRGDFCIQDEVSLPIGWGVFTGFIKGRNS